VEIVAIRDYPAVPSADLGSLQPEASFDVPADNEFAIGKREIAFRTVLPDELEVRHGILLPHPGSRFKTRVGLSFPFKRKVAEHTKSD
jgi:hypothetical protein